MSNNFLDAKKPQGTGGWIEYAILKFWEDCSPIDEHIADNAGEEIATLRAQLAEAVSLLSTMTPLVRLKYGNKYDDIHTKLLKAEKFLSEVTPA